MPTPFNVIPSPKSLWYLVKWIWTHLCKKKMRRKPESFGTIGVRTHPISITLSLMGCWSRVESLLNLGRSYDFLFSLIVHSKVSLYSINV